MFGRRTGVNEGDVVRIKRARLDDYLKVHRFDRDEAFDVVKRRAAGIGAAGAATYWLELKGRTSGGLVLAKPGHLVIVTMVRLNGGAS